jgi:hypothetical protein
MCKPESLVPEISKPGQPVALKFTKSNRILPQLHFVTFFNFRTLWQDTGKNVLLWRIAGFTNDTVKFLTAWLVGGWRRPPPVTNGVL